MFPVCRRNITVKMFKIPTKFPKTYKGLILNEALLAIALLSVAAVIMSTILTSSSSTLGISQNFLIAQNLAQEGIESVKNIRDTNKLKFRDEPDKWLCYDPNCENATPLAQTYYIPTEVGGEWVLRTSNPGISYTTAIPDFTANNSFKLNLYNWGGTDFQKYVSALIETEDLPQTTTEVSRYQPFYRAIYFDVANEDRAFYTVVVQWKQGTKRYEVVRKTAIYNY